MRQYVLQRCFERLISQRQEGKPVIQLRHQQPSLWEGLFAQEVAELWEPWMRVVDQLLEDEELLEAVYHARATADASGSSTAHADLEARAQLELRDCRAGSTS